MATLYEFLKTNSIKEPKARKIYFGRDISGEELLNDIDRLAGFLQRQGIKKGDVVAICLPNIPQSIVALYALNSIGAVAYLLHPKTGADFFAQEVKKLGVKGVFLFDRFAKKYKKVIESVDFCVLCDIGHYLPFPKSLIGVFAKKTQKAFSYAETLKGEKGITVQFDGKDNAILLNSSGTTAEPKIVALSSNAFNELAQNVFDTVCVHENYTKVMGMLMTLPLFHGFGLGICVHLGLLVGYVVPIPLFRPATVLRTMKKIPVNIIVGVPGMLRKMCNHRLFKGEFLKNIRFIFTGGDKVSDAVKDKFEEKLRQNGCRTLVMEGYGLSEVASVATINIKSPHDGSLGQAIKNVKVGIFADGKLCGEGEKGEIGVSSPSVMNGYLDGQECEYYVVGEDRYLATGDIGYKLGESIYFVERKKRMIKIGGVNVFPSQVEETAVKYEGVEQACAVRTEIDGKPCIKLLIVSKNTSDDFTKGLCAFIGSSLLKYAEPRIVERVDSIKTTMLGKADYAYYEKYDNRTTRHTGN